MKTDYQVFRTRTFADIFTPDEDDKEAGRTESVDVFLNVYNHIGITPIIKQATATNLFYLLYANYGNSHIASSDETQFLYRLFSIIFMYGPTWEKRLDIQANLRALTEADLLQGAKQIINHAYNPGTEPSTGDLEELEAINEQNTNNYKRSKLDAYGALWDLLSLDVTKAFLDKFKDLFIKVIASGKPLLYVTEEDEEGDVEI